MPVPPVRLSAKDLTRHEPFDVVVIAFGNLDLTFRCINSVLYGEPDARVILVDNGSDLTAPSHDLSVIEALFNRLPGDHEYIRLGENVGPYGAANAGIARVRTERFAFLCNDCAVFPGDLRTLVDMPHEDYPYVSACEVQTGRFDSFEISSALGKVQDSVLGYRDGVFFTCFATLKDFAAEVGPFDTRFRLTFGDTDWEQRANDVLASRVGPEDSPSCLLQTTMVRVFHGASVTRKRLGIEADLRVDTADHRAFLDKWQHREDVVTRHPLESPAGKKAFLADEWKKVGEQ